MVLGPFKRVLILDKPASPKLTIGLKWNNYSLKWQLLFLKDQGVRYFKVNTSLSCYDRKWWL